MAEKIVASDLLKKTPSVKSLRAVENKVSKMVEHSERLRTVKSFLSIWNKWRDYYFGLPPITVKSKGQLTMIENAIQFVDEHNYNVQMLIACVHKAYENRKFHPNFNEITARGHEHYERFAGEVESDIESSTYNRDAGGYG